MSYKIDRQAYSEMYGPTTGDKVRLGDTELWIEVEKDFTTYGEEVKFGGGKVIRDGMGQGQACSDQVVDTVITNALILDSWGIVKADVGIKEGHIVAIGKAGNSDIQPDVTFEIGAGTEVIAGEGQILTAGGVDSHIHFICPQQIDEALMSGVTTMLGGGTGPAAAAAGQRRTGLSAFHQPPGPARGGEAQLPQVPVRDQRGGRPAVHRHVAEPDPVRRRAGHLRGRRKRRRSTRRSSRRSKPGCRCCARTSLWNPTSCWRPGSTGRMPCSYWRRCSRTSASSRFEIGRRNWGSTSTRKRPACPPRRTAPSAWGCERCCPRAKTRYGHEGEQILHSWCAL